MADSVPVISISGEADEANWSLSDSEEAERAKVTIAARMRRRHKKKSGKQQATATSVLVVDDGEDSALTDVETVDVNDDSEVDRNTNSPSSPASDFTGIFDSVLRPQIVEIVDDHEGKTHVKSIVKGVIASLDGTSDEDEIGASLRDAATDVESLGDDDDPSEEHPVSEMEEAVKIALQLAMEQGGSVETHQEEAEMTAQQPPVQKSTGPMLLCPRSAAAQRRKPRKSKSKKKAASTPSSAQLTVAAPDDDPHTDIEDISGIEIVADDGAPPSYLHASASSGSGRNVIDDEGATDIEDFDFSDDDGGPRMSQLAPGIVVTGEFSDTESAHDQSGRSSRLGLTDMESISGMEDDQIYGIVRSTGLGLSIPQSDADPLTDVEDIDGVEMEPQVQAVPIPKNGPAPHGTHHQVVTIEEDENGTVTSRKLAKSPMLLGVSSAEDGGVSDVELLGASGDDDDDWINRSVTPEIEFFAGSTVHVKRHSLTTGPTAADLSAAAAEPVSTNFGLMPPAVTSELLTDTEDMDLSDGAETDPGHVFGINFS